MKPGIYHDLSNEDYHSGPGLSSSAIKSILRSPLHYNWEYVLGNRRQATAAMNLGSLVHTLILEPDKFDDDYAVVDVTTRNTKKYKDAVKAMPEKTIVLSHELYAATEMTKSLGDNQKAMALIDGASREVSMYWDEDGRLCKCRPDAWREDILICSDLKTTADASPREFERSVIKFGYHISAAWYSRGIHALTGRYPDNWAWIVVESKAPYAVMIYAADEALLEKGDSLCQEALFTLSECEQSGQWPAYSDQIEQITLPAWAA